MRNGERNPSSGLVRDGVTEILFQHLLPLESLKSPPLNLTRLTLWSVNLYQGLATLVCTFDPTKLKHLELVRCPYAGLFLHVLTLLREPLRVESLVIADYNTDPPDLTIVRGIETYLEASTVGSLKHFWLRLRGHAELPSATVIGRHGNSLGRLFLDVCESQARQGLPELVVLRYRANDVSQLLARVTPRLRQLRLGYSYSASSALATLSTGGFSTLKSHLVGHSKPHRSHHH